MKIFNAYMIVSLLLFIIVKLKHDSLLTKPKLKKAFQLTPIILAILLTVIFGFSHIPIILAATMIIFGILISSIMSVS